MPAGGFFAGGSEPALAMARVAELTCTLRGLTVAARKRGCGSGKRIAFSGEAQALRELLPRGGEKPFATSLEIGY